MNAYAKIHVLKRNAGLDEDSYRDLLERETGKRSSKGMTAAEQRKAIRAIERLLPETNTAKQGTERATGPFAKKLQALWIAGYNLGVVKNKSDAAMLAFLKRQTGLDHHRFLQDGRDANKAIDALKLWIRRVTGNEELFTRDLSLPLLYNDFRFQICLHLWSELLKFECAPARSLTEWMIGKFLKNDFAKLSDREWIQAMNCLGQHYRAKL
ncbi:regulatory protein GemA [Roseibium porphyridii]|uniref:Regulatory protein GemA n=1 Tax=Roseibium porphyridii TaxID=2866279 RepID=A0ABY8FA00_9HYPH|nr:regulatory protein GemA [Roseibium sp. KMA01]WFE92287.1 regulatory protein GemA [Roseibium sp. KMA01]